MLKSEQVANAFSRFVQVEPAPSQSESAAVSAASELNAERVTALKINTPNVCPYCQKTMRSNVQAVGVDVYVCDEDRHVAPMELPLQA